MSKTAWIIAIAFFTFIFGLPMLALMNTEKISLGNCKNCNIENVKIEMEQKKAKLKAEHDLRVKENMKKLHDGTYEPKPWAGFPWNRND